MNKYSAIWTIILIICSIINNTSFAYNWNNVINYFLNYSIIIIMKYKTYTSKFFWNKMGWFLRLISIKLDNKWFEVVIIFTIMDWTCCWKRSIVESCANFLYLGYGFVIVQCIRKQAKSKRVNELAIINLNMIWNS